MKKRVIMMTLLLSVCAAAAGCSKTSSDDKGKDAKTEETSTTGEAEEQEKEDGEDESGGETEKAKTTAELMADVDVAKCVTLGQYKGITVDKTIVKVTDDDVQKEIQAALESYPVEVEGRTAQEGDTVNIDYVGTLDGEEFDGGSDQGADLKLGSGQFVPGFEDGLIGAGKGEQKVINLTFPENYTEELAGKAVVFTVTVNAIKEPLKEPTDEWVAANIEGYQTVEEYKAGIRSEQEESNKQTAEDQVRYTAWTQVVDSSTINEYPQTLVDMGKKLYDQQAEAYAQYANMDLDAFIESSGISKDEYNQNAEEYGKTVAARALVAQAICDAEGYKIGDDGYKEEMEKMLAEYGVTEEELIANYGQDNVEQSIQLNRVSNLILENATINEVESDSKDTDDAADSNS